MIPKVKLCNLPIQDSFTPRLHNQVAKMQSPRDSKTVEAPRSKVGIFGRSIKASLRLDKKTAKGGEWNEADGPFSPATRRRKLAIHLSEAVPATPQKVAETGETVISVNKSQKQIIETLETDEDKVFAFDKEDDINEMISDFDKMQQPEFKKMLEE